MDAIFEVGRAADTCLSGAVRDLRGRCGFSGGVRLAGRAAGETQQRLAQVRAYFRKPCAST